MSRYEGTQQDGARITCGGSAGAEPSTALPGDFRAGADEAPTHTSISAVMVSEVVCIRDDLALDSLVAMLSHSQVAAFPVVDAEGAPIGIVSRTDLFRRLAEEEGDTDQRLCARDLMTAVVLTLPEWSTVAQAAAFMSFEGIHQIPVVSEHGKVVGMLSSLDILRWMAHRSGYLVPLRPTTAR